MARFAALRETTVRGTGVPGTDRRERRPDRLHDRVIDLSVPGDRPRALRACDRRIGYESPTVGTMN